MLKGKQKKLDVNKDGKISGKDFAILKAEKAKGRGMGLEDEKLQPGKEYVQKANIGSMIGARASAKKLITKKPIKTLEEPENILVNSPEALGGYKVIKKASTETEGSFAHGGSVIAKVKLGKTRPTKLY